jgi:hypothetical protein
VASSMTQAGNYGEDLLEAGRARRLLAGFRSELYRCLTARADELFDLADAVLCADGPVRVLAGLSLVPGHCRGHGAVYDALNAGRVDAGRLRWAVGCLPLPAWPDGRIRLAADVCNWLRPEARTSPERMFCHVHGRGRNAGQMIPGWPYSFVAALGPGATSWTAPLDAVRLGPGDDPTEVTAAQLREVAGRLAAAGAWRDGDPDILVVMDAGYDVTRLAWLLTGLPIVVCARLRSNRVFYGPPPPKPPGLGGRPREHGDPVKCDDPATWAAPSAAGRADTARYGRVQVSAWDRMHPKLAKLGGWARHPGKIPRIEGTLIQLRAGRLPGYRELKPLWLWASVTGAAEAQIAVLWQAFARRFDLEHTFLLQAGAGLGRPAAARPGRRRPVDLADHRRLHPAAARRRPGRRPAPALAAAPPARHHDPGPGPPRIPRRPRHSRHPRSPAKTRQTRPRTPERIRQPAQGTPPRRRQTPPRREETNKTTSQNQAWQVKSQAIVHKTLPQAQILPDLLRRRQPRQHLRGDLN